MNLTEGATGDRTGPTRLDDSNGDKVDGVAGKGQGPRAVMLDFASLGSNCEVGVAQRHFGAEPLDLFRWASTPWPALLAILKADFAGIGENLDITPNNFDYSILNPRYKFQWHSWTPVAEATPDQIAEREARRLPFLAEKMRIEMRERQRIFVIKQHTQPMPAERAARILHAMQTYGNPTLLYVTQGEPVSVVEVQPGLLHGTIPEFADGDAVIETTNADDWLALFRMVRTQDSDRSNR